MSPLILERDLWITETFVSIQGESSFAGRPTLFIRLSGCPLRCTWCDTTYSFARGQRRSLQSLLEEAERAACSWICLTGGEPLAQPDLLPLITALADRGFLLSIETSGHLSIADVDPRASIILDIKCPGSGMEDKNLWENLPLLRKKDEVKFVILDRRDYFYAREVCTKYALCEMVDELLFSPVHGELSPGELSEWILEDRIPGARLNLQMHKYINMR